ncbi:MAG: thiamine phosphate synthase [Verrucomicrobia bacterium]|nr:thiamine phosphate synthase [Verrucomicrobiota bacterium]
MNSIEHCFLYGIVDLGYVEPNEVTDMAKKLVRGGIDLLQLRAKTESVDEIRRLAQDILLVTQPAGVPLILNDYPQLLADVRAEGCHLGQEDGSIEQARQIAGRQILVGRSTHSIEQAIAAQQEGADYIGFGPLFPTPTKPDATAIGLRDLRQLHARVNIPIFCIGGIKESNLRQVTDAGAQRVCLVSDLLTASDPIAKVRAVKADL